jgi:hypothetical protein
MTLCDKVTLQLTTLCRTLPDDDKMNCPSWTAVVQYRLHKIKLRQSENNRTLTLLNEYMMYLKPPNEFHKMCRHKCSAVCHRNLDLSQFMSAVLFTLILKSVCLLHHGTDLQTPRLLLWTHAVSHANLVTDLFELSFSFPCTTFSDRPSLFMSNTVFLLSFTKPSQVCFLLCFASCNASVHICNPFGSFVLCPVQHRSCPVACCISSKMSWSWLLSYSHHTLYGLQY